MLSGLSSYNKLQAMNRFGIAKIMNNNGFYINIDNKNAYQD